MPRPQFGDFVDPQESNSPDTPLTGGGFQPQPPQDEQELARRVGGWQAFLTQIGSDRNLRNALMTFGSTALQPRRGGQTSAGQLGIAAEAGLNRFESGRQQDIENRFTERETERREEQTASNVAAADANIDATRAATGRLETLAPIEIRNLEEQIKAAQAANDPQRQELLLDRLFAEIEKTGADTQYTIARTRAIPDEIAARYVTASRPASKVQEARALAGTLVATGMESDPDKAMQRAILRLNPPRGLSPEQFGASLRGDLNEANLLKLPGAQEFYDAAVEGFSKRYQQTYGFGAESGAQAPVAAGSVSPVQAAERAWQMNNGPNLPLGSVEREDLIKEIRRQPGLVNWSPTDSTGTLDLLGNEGGGGGGF